MRCPDCNKFVSFDAETEPEVDIDMDNETVNITARIVNNCQECGTELKEAQFEWEQDCAEQIKNHECEGDGALTFSAEEASSERTEKSGNYDRKTGEFKPGGGRYAKTFYGASIKIEVNCDRCGKQIHQFTVEDEVQASSMEELT